VEEGNLLHVIQDQAARIKSVASKREQVWMLQPTRSQTILLDRRQWITITFIFIIPHYPDFSPELLKRAKRVLQLLDRHCSAVLEGSLY